MISYFDLRKGVKFLLEGEPFEVLEFQQMFKAQDVVVAKTKIRNLISGKILEKSFHKSDVFEEFELEKVEVKFIYSHRGKFCFSEVANPSVRFELAEEQIGEGMRFLKSNQALTGIRFQGKIINIVFSF